MTPKIIFEDNDLWVLDKPAGLVVDKSSTQKEDTLEDWSASQGSTLERGGIVHRLDKDTSGVILVAKTEAALENLQAQFKERRTKKEYLALVHGFIEGPGKVEGNIGRNPVRREKFTVLDEGKEAVTEYSPVKNLQFTIYNLKNESSGATLQSIFNDLNKIQRDKLERTNYNQFTLLKCYPLTGRTHQIRVHLKYINHPIVADEVYAGRKIVRLDHRWCPRQFLHAAKIGFYHPGNGKWMEVESELPEDLNKALGMLTNNEYL